MTEQPDPAPEPTYHALTVVLRDYLSYGESGMEDLRRDVHARVRKPVIASFCRELGRVLGGEAPVPTEAVNAEFRRRAEEHMAAGGEKVDPDALTYDDQQTYEALADLWEYLELTSDGEPDNALGHLRGSVRAGRSQVLWVPGDPVEALRTWMSWRSLALFLAGTVVCVASWAGYRHLDVAFLRPLLLLLTLAGFAGATVGGGALWLRRVRYVNPDAFLPAENQRKDSRR
ncbi:hypothetical protein GCM10023347_44480 [Streptomyces chumphonensis]|uniref:Uncharacterized protein n=1 Tax=Streptomyces chumphonensis TaxID=1214925 RepID=A0A927ICM8_9ACTN|nr:hypothetical protein [Streptomyces chumphonensis]MBD3932055.1 hypothetical protein [Streptomyces chumphonensis]